MKKIEGVSGNPAGRSYRGPGTFRVGSEAGGDGPRQDPTRIFLPHHGKGDGSRLGDVGYGPYSE
jgi:hypothetical protein